MGLFSINRIELLPGEESGGRKMMFQSCRTLVTILVITGFIAAAGAFYTVEGQPHRILLDTDVGTDDLFALLYLLKLNISEFDLGREGNKDYYLHQMQAVTISSDAWTNAGHAINQIYDILYMMDRRLEWEVKNYSASFQLGNSTAGYCRYRQAIPVGLGGILDIGTNYGFRKGFLPQRNIKHIYIMGGAVRSKTPTGCCPKNVGASCQPRQCGDRGNMFTGYTSNPYAEINIFGDPFAAYQVIHSGIPVTLVPLDAANTIPSYFMWDSILAGVATSIMRIRHTKPGVNEFAVMEFINITVVTSNEPYGISDGSNPFFDWHETPKFKLMRNGIHSGHVQNGLRDPFCSVKNAKGRCQDGYTKEVAGNEGVQVLVAVKAKPNSDQRSSLDREFYKSFLDVLNHPQHSGLFNITTQFPHYEEKLYKPDFTERKLRKNVVFDMDMSPGDFLALFYLLKMPVETMNLKAILISPTGWANGATIDVVYDLLHMMGRDYIPVGLGNVFANNQSDSLFPAVGDCKENFEMSGYVYCTYTGENSVKFGAPQDTDHPELRQPLAIEVWQSVVNSLEPGSKVTILTNGPLTTLAQIVASGKNMTSAIEDIFLGEILGAAFLGGDHSVPEPSLEMKNIVISAQGIEAEDGQMKIGKKQGKPVKVLKDVNPIDSYNLFATQLCAENQSAIVGSFDEQRRT
ncbi:OLC1v1035605C1 [Oldenlandia corymbosa var. corymbosa]|uniref:OLC1v1035605C1 n=1 Tax=Oldenlandia corymbosa var. corymbosa TaxID=529605 RepID=A0AAV1CWR5_OLDCO|nr:OLC1v1035605C1 [Oldenlandia corymbosa var. corymbosa]